MESGAHEGYDVVNQENIDENPYCSHGPTVLFTDGKKKYFSCSACRDKKLCGFYFKYEESGDAEAGRSFKASPGKLIEWRERYMEAQSDYDQLRKNYKLIRSLKPDQRSFCRICSLFLNKRLQPDEEALKRHQQASPAHEVISEISDAMLNEPVRHILKPVEVNSFNAQFIFDQTTQDVIINQLVKRECDSVLCVGTPSLFERIRTSSSSIKHSLLLDIDERLAQFYDQDEFVKYNMFNGHVFKESTYKQVYLDFLAKAERLAILIDPPYGGMVKLVANSIEKFRKDFKKDAANLTIMLFYPYFMEPWIEKFLPDLKMIDYRVSYENQKKLAKDSSQKKGSIARMFTNIDPARVTLPESEGYCFCHTCQKFTFEESLHCPHCDKCPSKDGGLYKHCAKCSRCVKVTYEHCASCGRCHLKGSACHSDKSSETNGGAERTGSHHHHRLPFSIVKKHKKSHPAVFRNKKLKK